MASGWTVWKTIPLSLFMYLSMPPWFCYKFRFPLGSLRTRKGPFLLPMCIRTQPCWESDPQPLHPWSRRARYASLSHWRWFPLGIGRSLAVLYSLTLSSRRLTGCSLAGHWAWPLETWREWSVFKGSQGWLVLQTTYASFMSRMDLLHEIEKVTYGEFFTEGLRTFKRETEIFQEA